MGPDFGAGVAGAFGRACRMWLFFADGADFEPFAPAGSSDANARCTRFMKVESSPFASNGRLRETSPNSGSSQASSDLAKSQLRWPLIHLKLFKLVLLQGLYLG